LVESGGVTGTATYRFDTTAAASGTDLTIVSVTCGSGPVASGYGYTATGDDLVLYDGNWRTFRRTCAR
jgi:hypothetical protein